MSSFKATTDRFGGVVIRSADESVDEPSFRPLLLRSLRTWRASGTPVVWFHVSRQRSHWLPILCEAEFRFHHASHDGDTAVLCRWLAARPSPVPPYAHTMVAVGGILLNSRRELLAVLQRCGAHESLKLPGGYVEPGEELGDAAAREVAEETGVQSRFLSCVSFRHAHGANFGCSDLYFLVHLEPLTTDIRGGCDEVLDARWISVDDFLQHPKVDHLNRLFIETFLQSRKREVSIGKQGGSHPVTRQPYSFYHVQAGSPSRIRFAETSTVE